ncbi:hypothetical protein PIB30_006954 [Stylosanthes scabra]|uniref:Uncharacterized protein n=1 Tax=Stylosanthes scabra TaxID=79078 RepID=A0ABU6Y646_9FABA|nr:hypothetical protein [Stylosanthes scabra]
MRLENEYSVGKGQGTEPKGHVTRVIGSNREESGDSSRKGSEDVLLVNLVDKECTEKTKRAKFKNAKNSGRGNMKAVGEAKASRILWKSRIVENKKDAIDRSLVSRLWGCGADFSWAGAEASHTVGGILCVWK